MAYLIVNNDKIVSVVREYIDGAIEITAEQQAVIARSKHGHAQFSYVAGELVEDAAFVAATSTLKKREAMTVTRFQALAALDAAGLLAQVEAIMANPATPNITKLAWNNALEFKRLSPTLVTLGATLGLTDEQLDALFTQAKNIEA